MKKERKLTVAFIEGSEDDEDEKFPIYFMDFMREVIRVNQKETEAS